MVTTGNFLDWRGDSGDSVATGVSVVAIKGKAFEAAKVTLSPGTELGHHSHPEDQFFYILEGKLKYRVGDEETIVQNIMMSQCSTFRKPRGAARVLDVDGVIEIETFLTDF